MFYPNEGKHRLLDSADTNYDTLITHIWAPYNFAALFSNAVGVTTWRVCWRCDVIHVIRKKAKN